jgi:protocatechuate 3,4-dioxygenase beta subunit
MIKRLCLFVFALVTAAGFGLHHGPAQAGAVPLPADPTTAEGWSGLPDLDRNSGRFLSVSGGLNFTLEADATATTRNMIRLCFDPAQLSQVRIASYDPGTRGRWDQRVDGTYVLTQPDTAFVLYPDPNNTVAPALVAGNPAPVAPILTLRALEASLANEDQTWCSLYDKPINDAGHAAAKNAVDGKYYFLMSTVLEAAPGEPLSGYEANAYKMAFNGTYAFPANAVIGVTCGVVDGLELIGPGGATLLVSNDPFPDILPLGQSDDIVNSYDGTVEFEFEGSSFCQDLQIQEADSDWNRALAQGEAFDPNPTGVPPDSGIRYLNPQPPQGLRDATSFAITGQMLNVPMGPGKVIGNRQISAIGYQVLRPNGTTSTTDEYSTARDAAGVLVPWGKASITNTYMAGWTLLPQPDPFAYMTIPQSELQANPGRWKLRAVGLDARNAIFFRWNQDFGTTPRTVKVSGLLWCDEDGDNEPDQAEPGLAGIEVELVPAGQQTGTKVTTDAAGRFSVALMPGTYTLKVLSDVCFPAKFQQPFTVAVQGCGEDVEVFLPYECVGMAEGKVFCNDPSTPGTLDPIDPPFDMPSVVVLERLGAGNVVLQTLEVPVAANIGSWQAPDLMPGSWRAYIKADPMIDVLTKTTAQPVAFTIDRTICKATVNFGYVCEFDLCGRLFCDKDGDCVLDPQGDEPLGGVTVVATLQGSLPPVIKQAITDVTGEFCFKVPNGNWIITIDPNQPALAGTTLKSAPPNPVHVMGSSIRNLLYCYECYGSICGTVYLNKPDCDGDYDIATDVPLGGIEVNLWLAPAGPPALPLRQVSTDALGNYCFLDLEPGTYLVQVAGGQPELLNIFPTQPTQRAPVLLRGQTVQDQDFGYCEKARILGKVFREKGTQDCDGVYQGDDTPIAGVTVSLVGTNPVRPPQLDITDANGDYDFPNLEPGEYAVSVDGGQPQLVVLAPGSALLVPVTLLAGDETRVDFPFCPGTICGTVYKNAPRDCDENYDLGADTPLPGITVVLWKAPAGPPALPLRSTVTGLDGGYCFKDLDAGTYRVQVGSGQPQLVSLTATQPVVRNPILVAGGTVLQQDFGYCELGLIRGRVFRENGTQDCDGVYQGDDTPIAGVLVSIVGTNPVRPPAVILTDADGLYAFTGLQAGEYAIEVNGNQPQLVVLAPGSAAIVPATVLGGDEVVIDFPFCPGQICGTVYKNDPQDCDEDYDLGFDLPLPGITVVLWLAPAGPPALPLRSTVTGLDGGYCFKDLDAGTYRVQVGGGQPQLVNLTPTQPVVRNPVVLPGGKVLQQDFGYCEPLGRIYGYVFENPTCTCDGTFDAGDTPKAGVPVDLTRFVGDQAFLLQTVTDANGFYEFTSLPAGDYTVQVDGTSPVLVDLTPSTPVSVGPFFLPAGGEERVDFGYCSQRLCGFVFREPPCECDGTFNEGDLPAVGVLVQLIALDGPQAGVMREQLTGPDGGYCFERLPEGRYEVSIPAGQAPLAGLEPTTDTVLTVEVGPGRCRLDANFGWCPPGEQKLCAKVFCEPKGECDGVFDEGRDTWMPWIEVFVAANPSDTYLRSGFTDENGRICFEGLPKGDYVIYVGANQGRLQTYKPSTPDCVPVTVEDCVEKEFCFGYCQDCKPTPCCEGDLREVLVGTSFWVGDCTTKFDIKARLLRGCEDSCQEVDRACRTWCGRFRGCEVGANEVLEIVDVRVSCGVAWVVMRIRAQGCLFEDGVFGRDGYSLRVTLNGVTYKGCAKLRCESFRPGQYFDLCCNDLEVPSCDCPWRWDGCSTWDSPWLCNPKKVCARYIVLDTLSRETWECRALSNPLIATR